MIAGALMTAAGTLALGACGSSGSGSSTSATSHEAATAASAAGATSQGGTGSAAGCREVPAPAARTGEREPQPSTGLDPAHSYTVTLSTNCGDIAIELDVKQAPKTAASFASLVQRGFYDNLTFHRVVSGFVIQGGDPNGNGTGGPGYHVIEPPPAGLQYTQGVVAMAKAQTEPPGSSGSQFFIVTGANINLPPQYALVGRVVAGEDTVGAISRIPTAAGPDGEQSAPSKPIVIEKATLSSH
jgi:cyclophilin family peptidyl-prolyl cis-trans isomerase